MKATSLIIILSGLSAASTIVRKEYYYINMLKTWAEAQTYCRVMFTDLATVSDKVDMDRLMSVVPDNGNYAWIGLHDNLTKWYWAIGKTAPSFTNWNPGHPETKPYTVSCAVMEDSDGLWWSWNCLRSLPSVCYSEQSSSKFILVETKMTWYQARSNCKTKYTDIASVNSIEQNNYISSLLSIKSWIGLKRKHWSHWSDKKNASFFNWNTGQPDSWWTTVEQCAVVNTTTGKWSDVECEEKHHFICHKVIIQDKTTFKLKFQSEADLNDPAIQQQILEQLHAKLDQQGADLKLHWIQTDGQTFHKQQKRKTESGPHC